MTRLQTQLDQLQKERVEIIELLSLNYLPSSLTIELLEAKLNYCIGQTDMLLASLEDAWTREDASPRRSSKVKITTKEYIEEYKSKLIQSKKDIASNMETHLRMQTGARGRRKTRGKDLFNLRRKAEIEAFKMERLREQCLHERTRSYSPYKSQSPSPVRESAAPPPDTASLSSSLSDSSDARGVMTPKQRKDYLLEIRRRIVLESQPELSELRQRSSSPRLSPRLSLDPDISAWPRVSARSSGAPDYSRPSQESFSRRIDTSSSSYSFSLPLDVSSADVSRVSDTLSSRVSHSLSPVRPYTSYFSRTSSSLSPSRPSSSLSASRPPLSSRSFGRLSSPKYRSSVVSSFNTSDVSADQLLEETWAARRANQQQISQAREVLRQLDSKRPSATPGGILSTSKRSGSSSSRRSTPLSVRVPAVARSYTASGRHISLSALEPGCDISQTLSPKATSSPRTDESFAAYARDYLARGERHLHSLDGQAGHRVVVAEFRSSPGAGQPASPGVAPPVASPRAGLADKEQSRSATPSSVLSTELDSFLGSSGSMSEPHASHEEINFSASRPISSQDIKARIEQKRREERKKED